LWLKEHGELYHVNDNLAKQRNEPCEKLKLHNQCQSTIRDYYPWIREERSSSQSIIPSKAYLATQNMQYQQAIDALIAGSPVHGFNGGRDALALLLDQIIVYKSDITDQRFSLLEVLLHHSQLKEMHYRRFSRLQLMYPSYYANLLLKSPELSQAENYPVSDYASLI